jgi:hypothetical protein
VWGRRGWCSPEQAFVYPRDVGAAIAAMLSALRERQLDLPAIQAGCSGVVEQSVSEMLVRQRVTTTGLQMHSLTVFPEVRQDQVQARHSR